MEKSRPLRAGADGERSVSIAIGARATTLPLGVAGLLILALAVPGILDPYYVIVLTSALVLAIACLGLNLLLGYTGMLSFGHAAYFGAGAYAGALLFTFGDMMSLEAYLLAGVLAAAALAAIVGLFCVRTTRMYSTILTLAFAEILRSLFVSGIAFRPFGEHGKGFFFVGEGGLYIPRFSIFGSDLPLDSFYSTLYYVVLAAFLASCVFMWRLVHSPFGLALRAIRDNAERAASIGIPVRRFRWTAFVLSGIFTGLAGALGGQLDRQVTPHELDWPLSASLVVATMLGGKGHFLGPVLGAFAIVAVRDVAVRLTAFQGLLFGTVLLAVVMATPGGLTGAIASLARVGRTAFRLPRSSTNRDATLF